MISASTPGIVTRLTDSPRVIERRAAWSPDYTRIAYDANGELHIADQVPVGPWRITGDPGSKARECRASQLAANSLKRSLTCHVFLKGATFILPGGPKQSWKNRVDTACRAMAVDAMTRHI